MYRSLRSCVCCQGVLKGHRSVEFGALLPRAERTEGPIRVRVRLIEVSRTVCSQEARRNSIGMCLHTGGRLSVDIFKVKGWPVHSSNTGQGRLTAKRHGGNTALLLAPSTYHPCALHLNDGHKAYLRLQACASTARPRFPVLVPTRESEFADTEG
jgi:hypothetical protein